MEVNPNTSSKLSSFGYAEMFGVDEKHNADSDTAPFECDKPSSIFRNVQYDSPQLLDNMTYDARKADNWALGMMLIHAFIGEPLYDNIFFEPTEGSAFSSLMDGKLVDYIYKNGLNKHLNGKMLSLINGLLNLNESKRFNSTQILQHPWFNCYYSRYKQKIEKLSRSKKKKFAKRQIHSHYCYM